MQADAPGATRRAVVAFPLVVLSSDEVRHDDGYYSRGGAGAVSCYPRMAVDESVARGLAMINVARRVA
jgi:hypothetical protein